MRRKESGIRENTAGEGILKTGGEWVGSGCRTRAEESGSPHISRKCSDVECKWPQKICSSQVYDVMLTYHFRRSPYQRVSLSPHIHFFAHAFVRLVLSLYIKAVTPRQNVD